MTNGFTYGANISYSPQDDTYSGTGIFQLRRTIPQALLDRLQKPNATVSVLITVTAGMWLKGAVLHSGRVYKYAEVPVEVSGVFMNNGDTSLTLKASLSLCVATAGTFFYDSAAQILYVHTPNPTTRSIYDDTYQAKLVFRFARKQKNLRGVPWHGRLVSAPSLSLRIDSKFSGVGQVGGGSLTLANRDGYFDTFDESIQWDAGGVSMEIGIDLPGSRGDLSESDYQPVGNWRTEKTARSGGNFVLTLREPKTKLELKIPRREFTRTEFPNIEENKLGKPIPWAWGKIFGVAPIIIDKNARKFKLADHPIRSIEQIRVANDTGGWNVVNYVTANLTAAEFTLSETDWSNNQVVSVDFFGRTNADGTLMENPADVMQDLLDYCGETQLDTTSFEVSRKWYRVGVNRFKNEVTRLAPCIYLDAHRTGLDVASEINNIAGSFLFVDHAGLWHYGAFRPVRAQDLDPMAGTIIQSFSERDIYRDSISKDVDSSKLYAKLTVEFARRISEGWTQRVNIERPQNQYIHNLAPQFTDTKIVGLSNAKDAKYWGNKFLTTEAEPLVRYSFTLPWKSFFIMPGDKVKVEHGRFDLNSVLEVYEAHYNFNSPPSVRFVAGNCRGWGDTFGFWIPEGSDSAFPTAGLHLWLAASDITLAHSESISTWNDKSGKINHATQSDPAKRPLINKFAGPHDEPGIQFGSGRYFDISAFSQNFSAGELFIVLECADDPAVSNNANHPYRFGVDTTYPNTSGNIVEGFGQTVENSVVNPAPTLTDMRLYNVSISPAQLIGRLDNAEIYNAVSDFTFGFSNQNYIGRGASSSTYFDSGAFIYEILFYNRVLATNERAAVVQYLSDKFQKNLVAAAASPVWSPVWTDAEVLIARQNRGYWTARDANSKETDMADITDRRSYLPSRWF